MIVLIEHKGERALFDNVTKIEEIRKPTGRNAIHLYSGSEILMGGDDLDMTSVKLAVLPNPEPML